ncbi:glycine cleavage system protein H [Alsobacter sp. SYSU M60028]|uniref:Glycine cleavage system protein H n=1 Tax=Alsobacter ponti TaxID=2962936 RepID=A0ABT1L9E2_9HYPH|nr:glycine cleavage system protein H [Alsobacter ponti]MCP8937568.1 glycine cleavage system protein H [Alsobacter ponti]
MIVRGCVFPDHLRYDVDNHVWYEPLPDGSFRLGMTSVAVALAGDILAFTPRRVGRPVEKNRACATVESGKWVGPARIAFDAEVSAVNDALIARPSLANADPYGAGWMIEARPAGPFDPAALLRGEAAARAYADWMDREGFEGCAEE